MNIFLYSYDAFRIVSVTGVKVVVIVTKVLLSKGLNIQMGNKSTQEKEIRFRSSRIGGSAMDYVVNTKSMVLRQPIYFRPDKVDAFLVNTPLKCSPETRMEPLAQTWHVKM